MSLFSSSRNDKLSRGGALSSTSEAFSLPVSSPITATHPDAFNSDSFVLSEPDSASASGPATYSYPPGRDGPYGYVAAGYALFPVVFLSSSLILILSLFRGHSFEVLAQDNQLYSPSITHHSLLPPHTHRCLIHGPGYVLG